MTAIDALTRESATVQNHGPTPVFHVTLAATAYVWQTLDEDVGAVFATDQLTARVDNLEYRTLGPGDAARFVFTWPPVADGKLDQVDVVLHYTDVAGTRWRREGDERPIRTRGTPLPGTAPMFSRIREWWTKRRRILWRSLRLGFTGRGFTAQGRRKRRSTNVYPWWQRPFRWLRARFSRRK